MIFSIGEFVRPKIGEKNSGDCTVVCNRDDLIMIAIVDVLGHGDDASIVANKISHFLQKTEARKLTFILEGLHKKLHGELGAAIGICFINKSSGILSYAGIGNTQIKLYNEGPTGIVPHKKSSLISKEGVVGERMHTVFEQEVQLEKRDLILLSTDGLKTNVTPSSIPLNDKKRAEKMAENMVLKFGKEFDDASCIIITCK